MRKLGILAILSVLVVGFIIGWVWRDWDRRPIISQNEKLTLLSTLSEEEVLRRSNEFEDLEGPAGKAVKALLVCLGYKLAQQNSDRNVAKPSMSNYGSQKSNRESMDKQVLPQEAKTRESRRTLLASLLPSEIVEWRELRREKEQDAIEHGDQFWMNRNQEPQARFDSVLANQCRGKYRGTLVYESVERRESFSYLLELTLKAFAPGSSENCYKLESKNRGSSSGCYGFQNFGTDIQSKTVLFTVSVPGLDHNISDISFRVPCGMTAGTQVSDQVFGLGEDLKWRSVGRLVIDRL